MSPLDDPVRGLDPSVLRQLLPQLFGPLDEPVLDALVQAAAPVRLAPGAALFRQGDAGDAWYLVLVGRLAVQDESAGPAARRVAELGRGEAVGELALLTGQPRSASVLALRPTLLARWSVASFQALLLGQPTLAQGLLRLLSQRLQQRTARAPARQAPQTVALWPASAGVDLPALATALVAAWPAGARAAWCGPAQAPAGASATTLAAWLDTQAGAVDSLLLVADPAAAGDAWHQALLAQADQVLLVADAGADPAPLPFEQRWLPAGDNAPRVRRSLLLLHAHDTPAPRGTARWLDARPLEAHLHLRQQHAGDLARVARALAGASIGLALSGGGARCFSQLGVARALAEIGVPVDHLAGTSAGAMCAGLLAGQRSWAQIDDAVQRFHAARPNRGFTLPLFSLLHGRRLQQALDEACGDTRLEDLWLPLTIVSSNLSRSAPQLHTRGRLQDALMASASLPGWTPPQVLDGELLVDGGLLDNLPVAVARSRWPGRVIAVDVCEDLALAWPGAAYPSPWAALVARLLRRGGPPPPGLGAVMTRSLLMASYVRTQQMRREADLCLRPDLPQVGLLATGEHARVIEAGYRHALAQRAALQAFVV